MRSSNSKGAEGLRTSLRWDRPISPRAQTLNLKPSSQLPNSPTEQPSNSLALRSDFFAQSELDPMHAGRHRPEHRGLPRCRGRQMAPGAAVAAGGLGPEPAAGRARRQPGREMLLPAEKLGRGPNAHAAVWCGGWPARKNPDTG